MVNIDYTWYQVFDLVGEIYGKITGAPDGIVAVLPQGMIPACLLQQTIFDIDNKYQVMGFICYEDGQIKTWDMGELIKCEKPHLLIVDAIIRSGDFMTLMVNEVLRQVEGATFETVVLLQQKDGLYIPSYCADDELGEDEWIKFPWQGMI